MNLELFIVVNLELFIVVLPVLAILFAHLSVTLGSLLAPAAPAPALAPAPAPFITIVCCSHRLRRVPEYMTVLTAAFANK